MSEPTPGPWHWVNNDWWGGYAGIVGPNNEEVLFPQTSNDGDTGAAWFEEISEADARLIASAPDLLKALNLILPLAKGYAHAHNVGSNSEYVSFAETVIAKAEHRD